MPTKKTIQPNKAIQAYKKTTFAKQSSKFARTICKLSKLSQEILLMAIGTINSAPKKDDFSVDFSMTDFALAFHKTKISSKQYNQQVFHAVMVELAKVICYENLESFYKNDVQHYSGTAYPLFYKAIVDTSKNIHFEFNPRALENIQELKPYEIIEFENAAKLRGKHAFNIYKYALSQQGFAGKGGNRQRTWWFEVTVEYLRAFLGIEDSKYKETNDLKIWCVEKPVAEINGADIGIRIEVEPVRDRKSIVGFRFDCEDTSPAKPSPAASARKKLPKPERSDDWKEEAAWLKMQETFAAEWERFYREEKESTPPELFLDTLARKKVYERMTDLGFMC